MIVSADPQVNKGVNRPLIPDDLRAASLAALECVDCVYVNPHPNRSGNPGRFETQISTSRAGSEFNHDPRFLAELADRHPQRRAE